MNYTKIMLWRSSRLSCLLSNQTWGLLLATLMWLPKETCSEIAVWLPTQTIFNFMTGHILDEVEDEGVPVPWKVVTTWTLLPIEFQRSPLHSWTKNGKDEFSVEMKNMSPKKKKQILRHILFEEDSFLLMRATRTIVKSFLWRLPPKTFSRRLGNRI